MTENSTIVNKFIKRLKNDTWSSSRILDGLEVESSRKPRFYIQSEIYKE